MAIDKTGNRAQYAGNGVTTEFSFPYRFFADADLAVFTLIAGVEARKTLATHYTVSNTGTEDGGTVTFLSAPASGTTVTVIGEIPQKQVADYTSNDAFPALTHETALDRSVRLVQQVSEKLARSIKVPASSSLSDVQTEIPEANAALAWNSTATAIVNGPSVSDIETASTSAAAAAASAVSAAASAASAASKDESMIRGTGQWLTATAYSPSDLAFEAGSQYECIVAHTSGVFATDLSAAKWRLFAEKGATGAGTGDMLGENNLSDVADAATARSNIGAQASITQLPLANGGTGAALSDPGADRLMFWDDSAGAVAFLTAGAGLKIDDTTITARTGFTYIGSQSVTSDATGIVTGLSAYRRTWIVGADMDQVLSGELRLRVGDSGGIITTAIYRNAEDGTLQTSFQLCASTNGDRGFSLIIENFNTTDAVKPVMFTGNPDFGKQPVLLESAAEFDRFSVFSSGGANNITSGTLYYWGEV